MVVSIDVEIRGEGRVVVGGGFYVVRLWFLLWGCVGGSVKVKVKGRIAMRGADGVERGSFKE